MKSRRASERGVIWSQAVRHILMRKMQSFFFEKKLHDDGPKTGMSVQRGTQTSHCHVISFGRRNFSSFQFEQLAVAAVGDGHRLSRSHLMKTIHVLEKSFGNRAKCLINEAEDE